MKSRLFSLLTAASWRDSPGLWWHIHALTHPVNSSCCPEVCVFHLYFQLLQFYWLLPINQKLARTPRMGKANTNHTLLFPPLQPSLSLSPLSGAMLSILCGSAPHFPNSLQSITTCTLCSHFTKLPLPVTACRPIRPTWQHLTVPTTPSFSKDFFVPWLFTTACSQLHLFLPLCYLSFWEAGGLCICREVSLWPETAKSAWSVLIKHPNTPLVPSSLSHFWFTSPVWLPTVCFLSFCLSLHSINCPCQVGHGDRPVLSHAPKTRKSYFTQKSTVCLRSQIPLLK